MDAGIGQVYGTRKEKKDKKKKVYSTAVEEFVTSPSDIEGRTHTVHTAPHGHL